MAPLESECLVGKDGALSLRGNDGAVLRGKFGSPYGFGASPSRCIFGGGGNVLMDGKVLELLVGTGERALAEAGVLDGVGGAVDVVLCEAVELLEGFGGAADEFTNAGP